MKAVAAVSHALFTCHSCDNGTSSAQPFELLGT